MTEQDKNNLKEGQEESKFWPGRYCVEAIAERWPHRGGIYENIKLKLFQEGMTEEEIRALLEPLGFKHDMEDGDYRYMMSYVEDTFSEEKADELIAYLESHDGTKAWKKPALKPVVREDNTVWAGVSALAVGGMTDFYHLHKEEGYNLSFKAEVYYSVEDAEYLGKSPGREIEEAMDSIRELSQEQLEELQESIEDMLEDKKLDRQALISSINLLISDMSVEALEDIEGYIARIED